MLGLAIGTGLALGFRTVFGVISKFSFRVRGRLRVKFRAAFVVRVRVSPEVMAKARFSLWLGLLSEPVFGVWMALL